MSTTNNFKKVRLFQLAKQFNVSVDALVVHMTESGHKDALTGSGINAAISTEEAYEDLLDYFADDRMQAERVQKKRAARREGDGDGFEESTTAVAEASPEPVVELVSPVIIAEEPEPIKEAPVVVEEIPVAEEVEIVEEPIVHAAEVVVAEPVVEAPASEEATVADKSTAEVVVEADSKKDDAGVKGAQREIADDEAPKGGQPKSKESKQKGAEPELNADLDAALLDDVDEDELEEEIEEEIIVLPKLPEKVFSADRYKLTGTTVLGKIDLGAVEDSEPGAKRKRKRKRKKV